MNELIVFLFAALPVLEVRASVPLGIIVYNLNSINVIVLSIIGSVLPVFPLLWFLTNLTAKLREKPYFNNFFEWLFKRTHAKSTLIKDLELIGLTLFIAIPLPGTGVWTGVIAAYLLDLPWIPTFFCALAGTAIASTIMWAASIGVINFFL